MRILLVEDDAAALKTLRQGLALSFPTFTIETAASAEDAEAKVAEGYVPQLVITDVRLPGRSGVDLLARLGQQYPELQFILTSGYSAPQLPSQAPANRMLRFLAKPFELGQLVAAVQDVFMRDQFSETHQTITFLDILQVLNMAQRTGLVQLLRDGEPAGEIYLVGGEVHHAAGGELAGEEAFLRLCQTPDTAFRVRSGVRPEERTIHRSLGNLLIDVMSTEEA